jgi:hypothetical protein
MYSKFWNIMKVPALNTFVLIKEGANNTFCISVAQQEELHLNDLGRALHNEELHNLYCSPSIIRIIKSRRMRWAGHVARMGAKRNAYRILVGRPEGKRPLGRPRRRWEDNNGMDLGDRMG